MSYKTLQGFISEINITVEKYGERILLVMDENEDLNKVGAQTKIYTSLLFSDMHQKQFLLCRNWTSTQKGGSSI